MTLATMLPASHVLLTIKATDKTRLLTDLAATAAAACDVATADIAAALRSREALGSTGVGHGIAVPHARLAQLDSSKGLLCFFARLDRAIDYEAIDGKKVDLVFMLLSPEREANAHLATLAAVSRRLRDPSVSNAIRAAASAEALRMLLVDG